MRKFKIYTQYEIRKRKEQQNKDLFTIAMVCIVIIALAAGLILLN